ncbi:hypothetical protein [Tsukamurella spumae]|uniref:Uncharacterized protein n=1 Tax=Tsukamurella spumae TaxID=44753 RepID=A0A846WUI8_9ACTN|nr:hypothetical protein [Tsukamurella spumae]NKY16777.1 hypothetical protein [Tsukamurella spumae]
MDLFAGAQLRVYVRDLISGELVAYPAAEWLGEYPVGINSAIQLQQGEPGRHHRDHRNARAGAGHRQRRRPHHHP